MSALNAFKKINRLRSSDKSSRSRPTRRRSSLRLETLEKRSLLAAVAVNDGAWSDQNTWEDNVVPSETQRVIINRGVAVQLDLDSHAAKEIVVHGDLVVPEDASVPNKSLDANWIHVNSGGRFIVGTSEDRYDIGTFTVNLKGTDVNADHTIPMFMMGMEMSMPVENNDGFLMVGRGGSIELYGEDKLSFTKLAANAKQGDDAITVANVIERNYSFGNPSGDGFETSAADDGEVNWEVGDQIVVASSSYDYRDEDVRTIVDIDRDEVAGTVTLSLDRALDHDHYGQIETYGSSSDYQIDMRAEVALLSRNIKIQGEEDQDTDVAFGDRASATYGTRQDFNRLAPKEFEKLPSEWVTNGVGGHVMIMPGSDPIAVDGVQLNRLGQASQKGRYPIHWHLAGKRDQDVFRNSSITNSNNRGVTIHGTDDLMIEGVVLHDIHGHGFFFEDAVETGNKLVGNIALGIHTVGGNDDSAADPGDKDPFIVDTHDSVLETPSRFSSSAAYWITHPSNTFVGNIAAGAGDSRTDGFAEPGPAGTGFWYAIPRASLGDAAKTQPDVRPIFAEFGTFDHNTSHATAIGLNFDRGSDLEDARFPTDEDQDGVFDDYFDFDSIHVANEYSPRQADGSDSFGKVNHFTNYKASQAAVYHRGNKHTISYEGLRIADSYNGAWAVSETTFDNSLYVGHSRGNSGDKNDRVGGPRLYDGAGLHTNAHFAGFADQDAFTFQVEASSFGPTMYHAFVNASFEDDGTHDHLAHAIADINEDTDGNLSGHNLERPHEWIKAVIDLDGSLTTAHGGGAGYSIVPDVDFLVDQEDLLLPGGDAYLTNDIYARIRVENLNNGSNKGFFNAVDTEEPLMFFTTEAGNGTEKTVQVLAGQSNGDHSWTQIAAKADTEGDVEKTFTITFGRNGIPDAGFVLNMKNQDGGVLADYPDIQAKVERARIVTRIVGAGNHTPNIGTEVFSEADLRAERQPTEEIFYYRDGLGNLYLNTGIRDSQPLIEFTPGVALQSHYDPGDRPDPPIVQYGSTLEAEEFDNSFDNLAAIAYSDNDVVNSLGSFRSETGVDATETKVGAIADGEWLEYTAEIAFASYNIDFNVASTVDGGRIRVLAATSNTAEFFTDYGTIDVPNTGGEWQIETLEQVNLSTIASDSAVIRLEFIGGGFELDSMNFEPATQTPFRSHTIAVGTTETIQLEDYDEGGPGAAYFDTTSANEGSSEFRIDEGVDTNGTIITNDIIAGEWLEYTADVEAGTYDITLGRDWSSDEESVTLLVGETNSATTFTELGTFVFGGDIDTLTLPGTVLGGGENMVFRLVMNTSYFGLDSLEFKSVGVVQTPYMPHSITSDAPHRLELEHFDIGGEGVAYHDTSLGNNASTSFRPDEDVDTNGDLLTDHVNNGEWLEYTTDIEAGAYDITLEKGWSAGEGTIRLLIADDNSATEFESLGEFAFGAGGNELITLPAVDLDAWAGEQRVIRIEVVGDWMGLNGIDFVPVSTDTDPPTVDIVDVTPDPRNTHAGVVTIDFSEDVVGVDMNDFSLLRDGETVDLTGLSITQVSAEQYTVDLSGVTTADGDYELRVHGAGSGIQDLAGNALATDAVDQFMVDTTAPRVESVDINDGHAQRSMVSSLRVTFSEDVGSVDAGSFVLTNTTTNTQVGTIVTTELIDGRTVATLTFTGDGVVAGSLVDGNYTLTTLGSVADAAGNRLDGDGDGAGGDDAITDFFRLYGDINGDRTINIIDFFRFRDAFRGNYDAAFDFNGDGVVNVIDFFQFRSRFGSSI
ncbi:MAG: G8 domain-containing protein [Planctomycetota bacterium]